MNDVRLAQTLAGSFHALADEVQSLIDRNTILEHKLRYAHEQYQYLADKYAPGAPKISEILAKIQLPPALEHHIPDTSSAVPLPKQSGTTQHQIALLIREGRRAAQQLTVSMADSRSSKDTSPSPPTETMTTISTVLEQDFTVEGKKGLLACPFSPPPELADAPSVGAAGRSHDPAGTTADPTPHKSTDPICVAMLEEKTSVPVPAASKCPIRYLDKHSPEEIAKYVETHKHEIPRSHEVCVGRYQKNEESIRKLDAKYGNLVSMINDLSMLHRPMLPLAEGDDAEAAEVDKLSSKRVEDWAQTVTLSDPEQANEAPVDEDRESYFERPLRDVRVGESPSRPWGISVPLAATFHADDTERPASPPPAPPVDHQTPKDHSGPRKCPFDHTKMPLPSSFPKIGETSHPGRQLHHDAELPSTPVKTPMPPAGPSHAMPTFINLEAMAPTQAEKSSSAQPQMIFNISGPVFIGYPMEQALEFMQRYQAK
ncbi:hypothetical protein QBC34DRAFT_409660 [Podospora aff. communis PSN243]|uniref:Uncharacterized protein n=1 Tax=Podospora aff. communis PSN243 TaxID=3040156 RepID=A0AAV9GJF6_9PEZI|nr:hypothetical protein QBC34DRAFT_409660 [Podospora aff. communis PSN243]